MTYWDINFYIEADYATQKYMFHTNAFMISYNKQIVKDRNNRYVILEKEKKNIEIYQTFNEIELIIVDKKRIN